jgi:hypothetical protein
MRQEKGVSVRMEKINERYVFEAVDQAMCVIICGIDLPLVLGAMMRGVKNPIRGQVPHLGIPILQILFHAKIGLLRLVLSQPHVFEFSQAFLDGAGSMHTGFSRSALLTPIYADLGPCFPQSITSASKRSRLLGKVRTAAMAHIGFVPLDKLHGERVQLVEVIARVGNLPRFVPQPPDHLKDTLKVSLLLRLRIRIVVSQVSFPTMMSRVPKVDKDRLGMPDV